MDKPLDEDMHASMRGLLRVLCSLRARISSSRDPLIARVNVLIAIAGSYFGQDEQLAILGANAVTF